MDEGIRNVAEGREEENSICINRGEGESSENMGWSWRKKGIQPQKGEGLIGR